MKKAIFTIVGVAASVRILFSIPSFIDVSRVYSIGDATGYELLAVNLLDHNVFSLSEDPPYEPDPLRTPLYPLLLSAFYSIFGRRPRIILVLQIFISTLTALMVYALGRKINPRVAFAGAVLCGLSPNLTFYSTMLLTEVLFTFLLITGIFMFIRLFDSHGLSRTVLSGFLFGLSSLTRPISLYFPLIMSVPLLWTFRGELRKGIYLVAVFLGVYLVSLSPWIVRNVKTHDRLIFTTAGELNIFHYHAAMVKSVLERIGVDDARRELGLEAIGKAEQLGINSSDEAQISLAWSSVALGYLKKSPLIYLRLHGLGFISSLLLPLPMNPLITYFAPSDGDFSLRRSVMQDAFSLLSRNKPIQAITLVWRERIEKIPLFALIVYMFGAVFQLGLLTGILFFFTTSPRRMKDLWILVLPILYFMLVPGPLAGPRFRAPVEPLLIIIATLGFWKKFGREQACKPSSVSRLGRDGDH